MKRPAPLTSLILCWIGAQNVCARSLGLGEADDGIQVPLARTRRFTALQSNWTLTGAGCKQLVDKLTSTAQKFYTPIKDLYNVPVGTDKRLMLCDKDLFQEPSCVAGLGCLTSLGGRLTNYRYYLTNLRSSGKGSKLNKTLLGNTIDTLQDVLTNLQRDCSSRSSPGASCAWPSPAQSCLPSGLAYDNNDIADETAVTLCRGLLEVTKRTKYA